ncbi:MAG TPA: type III pantothenate kinase [Bacteroidales bacterium]|nr:type III pantothenate kinase [Bacteroidales bacterium]
MKLVIDVGNTLTKLAVFEGSDMLYIHNSDHPDKAAIDEVFQKFEGIRTVIVGSVRHLPENLHELFPEKVRLHILSSASRLPVSLDYDTPETLGTDRIAAVVAANHLFPGKNVLVIESGTCITYDLIDAGGVYRGGSISPGMGMRFKALNTFTDKLPLINPTREAALTGKSTETSIQSGVINGMVAEMKGIIADYQGIYDNLTIILSGGNLDYFDKNLKNNIFAVPNIVITGLRIIQEFNDKN